MENLIENLQGGENTNKRSRTNHLKKGYYTYIAYF